MAPLARGQDPWVGTVERGTRRCDATKARHACASSIARSMRATLKTSGLSISAVARLCGVSQPAMSMYLSGKRCPDATTVALFCVATNTSASEILAPIDRFGEARS